MRALTMDEVGCVNGGRGILPTYDSNGMATLTNSGSSAFGSSYSANGGLLLGGAVNGGFASQDAQLQCYADWLNAGCPDIQGQSESHALSPAQNIGLGMLGIFGAGGVVGASIGLGIAQHEIAKYAIGELGVLMVSEGTFAGAVALGSLTLGGAVAIGLIVGAGYLAYEYYSEPN